MTYNGPGVFRAPYGNDDALENFRRTVLNGVEKESITQHIDTPFDNDVVRLWVSDEQKQEIVSQISTALNAGKHVVLTGPPGTGKTEIARLVCKYLVSKYGSHYSGYQMTTATADWSTFESVGGYMPDEGDGKLQFEPGQVLRRFKQDGVQQNEPLIIDEINRADIDKAFGQLFTLLSGHAVQLPYKRAGQEIEIKLGESFEGAPKPHEYVMPASWRLFATMNSYDKTSLYELSYAFMRRFAFVHIDAPTIPEDEASQTALVGEYADVWGMTLTEDTLRAVGVVWHAANTAVQNRNIGPAIIKDLLSHLEQAPRDSEARKRVLTRAVVSYVFPQLEGVPRRGRVVERIASTGVVDGEGLRRSAGEILSVDLEQDG